MPEPILKVNLLEIETVRITLPDGRNTELPFSKLREEGGAFIDGGMDPVKRTAREVAYALEEILTKIRASDHSFDFYVPLKLTGTVESK